MSIDTISYPVQDHLIVAKEIADIIKTNWLGHYFLVPDTIGSGTVEAYSYEGFSVMLSKFRFNREINIGRLYSTIKDQLVFGYILNGSTSSFVVGSARRLNQLYYGANVTTPSTVSHGMFKKNVWHEQISVMVDKNWIESYLQVDLPTILQKPNKPLFIITELSFSLANSLRYLIAEGPMGAFRKKEVHVKCLEAVMATVKIIVEKGNVFNQKKYHPDDLGTILRVADHIKNSSEGYGSIQKLAATFNINKDKLQTIFKGVHGMTISKYTAQHRMDHAYRLLLSGRSVSEAGRFIGYTNLSHFSRAFKKAYGFNPSQMAEANQKGQILSK
ncbi:MAG: AraC family transcriptional regulator [Bacteroidota bacterium]